MNDGGNFLVVFFAGVSAAAPVVWLWREQCLCNISMPTLSLSHLYILRSLTVKLIIRKSFSTLRSGFGGGSLSERLAKYIFGAIFLILSLGPSMGLITYPESHFERLTTNPIAHFD